MYDNSIDCPTPESHNWGCGCPTDRLPARNRQEAEAILHEAMDHGVYDAAVRQKLIDRLTEACRHEATLATAGVRDAARQAAGQPDVCACSHPQTRHLSACTECPCVGYAPTWPRSSAAGQPDAECVECGLAGGQSWWCLLELGHSDRCVPRPGTAAGQPDTQQQTEPGAARRAVYSGLMWPEYNPRAERRGTSDEQAEQLLDAYRAEVLREAAEKFTALAENAHMEALSNDDIGHASGLENAAAELRCMADEAAQ